MGVAMKNLWAFGVICGLFLGSGLLTAQNNATGLGRDPVQGRVVVQPLKTVSGSASALPASFDLRQSGRLTPVRDQGPLGTCWTFATYGSLESNLVPYLNPGSDAFSEQNLKNTHGFALGHNDGGTALMSMAYMARWSGPVPEGFDPYSTDPAKNSSPAIPASAYKVRLQSVDIVANKNAAEVKRLVMDQGALYSSLNVGDSDMGIYFDEKTASFYNPVSTVSNHAIVIVGWDDNYPRDRFKAVNGQRPRNNGAFIIRNSWGTGWGDKGYFYVSYEDRCIAAEAYSFVGDPEARYNRIYQYDTHGAIGWWTGSGTAVYALRFTAKDNEDLQAVGLFTDKENSVYAVGAGTSLAQAAGAVPLAQGTLRFPGYHTLRFNQAFSVTKGQDFYVSVRVSSSQGSAGIPLEMEVAGYVSRIDLSKNSCFVSFDGTHWDDVTKYDKSNVALKVFTTQRTAEETPKVSRLVFDAEAVSLILGESRTFKVSYLPQNAPVPQVLFLVDKADADKVKIDDKGQVTALKPGVLDLLAVTGDKRVTARCRLTINTPDPAQKPLVFADPALEKSLRQQLGKPNGALTGADLVGLSALTLNPAVRSLAGLEPAANLTSLDLSGTAVSDLRPLASLKKLRVLGLRNIKTDSLTPLKSLGLDVLDLGGSSVKDLSALGSLKTLTVLSLAGCGLKDARLPSALSGLKKLDLQGNQIADVSPLASLANLEVLYLAGNPVRDFNPLRTLAARLTDKDFELKDSDKPVFADSRVEAQVRQLLGLKNSQDLSFAMLKSITDLDLSRYGKAQPLALGGVDQLTSLVRFKAPQAGISDASALSRLKNLRQVELYGNKLTSLDFAAGLTQLTLLDAGDNQIVSVKPLATLAALEELELDSNKISDPSPLKSLKSLAVLNLSGNQLTDVKIFASIKDLKVLNLAKNQLTAVQPLTGLKKLTSLYLRGNPIQDFSVLKPLRAQLEEYDFQLDGKTFDPADHDFGHGVKINDFASDSDMGFVDESKYFAVDEKAMFTSEEEFFGDTAKEEADFFGDSPKPAKKDPKADPAEKKKPAPKKSEEDDFFDN